MDAPDVSRAVAAATSIADGVVELVTAREFIESAAQIGVILLLLLLELEYSGSALTGALRRNGAAGALDLVLNFTPGVAVGALFGWARSPGCLV